MIEYLSLNISAFLVTYFVHSAIFIIAALVAIKLNKLASDRLGEYILKSALLLGIITTGIQNFAIPTLTQMPHTLNYQWQTSTNTRIENVNKPIPISNIQESNEQEKLPALTQASQITQEPTEVVPQSNHNDKSATWTSSLIIIWLILTLILLGKKIIQWQQLKHCLKQRKQLTNVQVKQVFAILLQQSQLKRQVTLSESNNIDSPIALTRNEVVLPTDFYKEKDVEHLKAALAHELAHIKRFDGYWLWFGLLIESILFIQPLNRLINKKIYQLAELRSDKLAAQWTGNPRALAETLSQVAHNTFINNSIQMVPAMTSNKSDLRIRIENLIFNRNKKTASLSILFISLLCAVVLIAAPGVSINTATAWPFSDKSSRSINIKDDGHSKITINSSYDDKSLKLKAELNGHINFNDDESKIIQFPANSSFDVSIKEDGVKRRLLIKSDDADPSYNYYLNGDAKNFDQAAQTWFASIIPEILRITGIDAKKRVERISKSRGHAAVLEEIKLIDSDFTKKEYFQHLFTLTELSSKDQISAIKLSQDIGSDFEQSAVLSALVETQNLSNETVWQQALIATTTIGSDFEQAKTLINFIDKLPQSSSINNAYFNAAKNIGSDFEMRKVFSEYLKKQPKHSVNLIQMYEAAKSIGSDFELASLLIDSKDHISQSKELFSAYIDLAETIGSDFELKKVYSNLLSHQIDKDNLNRLIESAQSNIGSDFELANLLSQLIKSYQLDAQQIQTVKIAAKSIGSQFERNRVLSALIETI